MKKLRRKIVFAVFVSATVVFALIVLLAGSVFRYNIISRSDSTTELIEANNGLLPPKESYDRMEEKSDLFGYHYDEESPYRIRYFSVIYENDNIKSVDISHIASIDENDARDMAERVKDKGVETGNYHDFRYRISKNDGSVFFMDCSEEYRTVNTVLIIMSLVALAFVLLITVVFYFVSGRVVRPFEENSRMQKQFITDASHELKTPLAIISANAEVLAYKDGENEWIKNITDQTVRISELINEMLTLNRLEEIETNVNISPLNLSEILTAAAREFDEVFVSKHVTVKSDIQPDVTLNGNSDQLRRLASVLIENASKYVEENGRVELSLRRESRYTVLRVFNTCEIDPDADYKHLFDRFYRPDMSRTSKTGGHGIGLSIAKRIVVLHNGSIEAQPAEDGLGFIVKLSNKLKTGRKSS